MNIEQYLIELVLLSAFALVAAVVLESVFNKRKDSPPWLVLLTLIVATGILALWVPRVALWMVAQ